MLWPQYIVRTHRSRENIFIWRNNCESDYMCSSSSSRSSNIPTIMVVLLLPTSLSIIEWPEWPRFSYISNIVIFSNNRLQNPTSVKIFSVALRLLWPLPTTNCGSSTGSDGSKFFIKFCQENLVTLQHDQYRGPTKQHTIYLQKGYSMQQ